MSRPRARLLLVALFAVFTLVLAINAWVVDDAYITFRTVDNLTHGYGLTWNVEERVQVYTHPLWMLLVSSIYLFTSEAFYTAIVLSMALTLAAALAWSARITDRFRRDLWRPALLVLGMVSSKAVLDYASSGLESPLSYLVLALFFAVFVTAPPSGAGAGGRRLLRLTLLASAAFLNRPDTILIVLPALAWDYLALREVPPARRIRIAVVASLPASGWCLFSLVYYGYLFPNTAYAKMLATGYPLSWRLTRGLEYLANSVRWDTLSYGILAAYVWLALRRRSAAALAPLAGVLLYIVYVVVAGASATHMSGRFLAVPLFVAVAMVALLLEDRRAVGAAFGLMLIWCVASPVSALRFGTPAYHPYAQNPSCIDTKYFVLEEGAALLDWRPGRSLPDHAWYHYGEQLRRMPQKVHVGGAFGGEAIGYVGYAAGPGKYIVDLVALGDPLLSHLPALRPPRAEDWKSGHFHRAIPAGYLDSLAAGTNLLQDPDLKRYYDAVRIITRGRILDMARLETIARMNLGLYDPLINAWAARHPVAQADSAGGEP